MLHIHCEVLSCIPELRWRVKPESVLCWGFDIFGTWVLPFTMNSRPSHNAADDGRFANCIYEASLRNRLLSNAAAFYFTY